MGDPARRSGVLSRSLRWLLPWPIIITSLVCGALITVLVSWTLALNALPVQAISDRDDSWPVTNLPSWPSITTAAEQFATRRRATGIWQWTGRTYRHGPLGEDLLINVTRSGWPMLAMQATLRRSAKPGDSLYSAAPFDNEPSFEAGLAVSLHLTRPHPESRLDWRYRRLPLEPVPFGFVVNTLVFSGMTCGMIALWRVQPQRVRSGRVARRSRLVHPVFLLLVGAALNLAVAGSAWWRWQSTGRPLTSAGLRQNVPPRDWSPSDVPVSVAVWPCDVPTAWPATPERVESRGEAFGVRAYGYESTNKLIDSGFDPITSGIGAFSPLTHNEIAIVQSGWPLPCVQSEELIEHDPAAPAANLGALKYTPSAWSIPIQSAPTSFGSSRFPLLPARPLPLGLICNTLLYTAAISLLILIPGAIYAIAPFRSRSHRCENCGYDAHGLKRCPECGTTMKWQPLPTEKHAPPPSIESLTVTQSPSAHTPPQAHPQSPAADSAPPNPPTD